MTPDELLKKLENMGIIVSRRTLLRYEQNKLIAEPKRGSVGRGVGRFTDYHENTPYEFFASWCLLKRHKESIEHVAEIRDCALNKDINHAYEIVRSDISKEYLLKIDEWNHYVKTSQSTIIERMDEVDEQFAKSRKFFVSEWDKHRIVKEKLREATWLIEQLLIENKELKDQLKKNQDPIK